MYGGGKGINVDVLLSPQGLVEESPASSIYPNHRSSAGHPLQKTNWCLVRPAKTRPYDRSAAALGQKPSRTRAVARESAGGQMVQREGTDFQPNICSASI